MPWKALQAVVLASLCLHMACADIVGHDLRLNLPQWLLDAPTAPTVGRGDQDLDFVAGQSGAVVLTADVVFGDSASDVFTGNFVLAAASGATAKGIGVVDGSLTLNSGTGLAPGLSPGILNTGDVSLLAGSTLNIELNSPYLIAGTDYDQLNVTGTVTLGGNLVLDGGAVAPSGGEVLTIIANDGTEAVAGTFSGLAEGAAVSVNNFSAVVSYQGGDGNDVTLTVPVTPQLGGKPRRQWQPRPRRRGHRRQLDDRRRRRSSPDQRRQRQHPHDQHRWRDRRRHQHRGHPSERRHRATDHGRWPSRGRQPAPGIHDGIQPRRRVRRWGSDDEPRWGFPVDHRGQRDDPELHVQQRPRRQPAGRWPDDQLHRPGMTHSPQPGELRRRKQGSCPSRVKRQPKSVESHLVDLRPLSSQNPRAPRRR